jgi:uncharacterized membrane protein
MRVKVLILALLAVIIALPFPASQLLAGPFSAPAHISLVEAPGALGTLLEDPFLADHLSFVPARSAADLI